MAAVQFLRSFEKLSLFFRGPLSCSYKVLTSCTYLVVGRASVPAKFWRYVVISLVSFLFSVKIWSHLCAPDTWTIKKDSREKSVCFNKRSMPFNGIADVISKSCSYLFVAGEVFFSYEALTSCGTFSCFQWRFDVTSARPITGRKVKRKSLRFTKKRMLFTDIADTISTSSHAFWQVLMQETLDAREFDVGIINIIPLNVID